MIHDTSLSWDICNQTEDEMDDIWFVKFQWENVEDVNISFDFIFVDMQVNNNGGPSIVRELKRSEKVIDSTIVLLIDREADSFQAKRVGADSYLLKPLEKTKLKNLFT